MKETMHKYKRDNTPMFDYYKAWDKFSNEVDPDIDQDSSSASNLQAKNPVFKEEPRPQTQAEMMKPTSGARPNTSIVVKGARQRQISIAEEFKIQGNSYFSSLDYSKAIECYTRCLNALAKD